MPVNDGAVSRFVSITDGNGVIGGVTIEIYYDHTGPYDPINQAIVNDTSRGHGNVALWCNNTSPKTVPMTVTQPDGTVNNISVPAGETTRTRQQLAAVGITTREDAQTATLASG